MVSPHNTHKTTGCVPSLAVDPTTELWWYKRNSHTRTVKDKNGMWTCSIRCTAGVLFVANTKPWTTKSRWGMEKSIPFCKDRLWRSFLRRLVAGRTPRRPRYDSRPVHVVSAVEVARWRAVHLALWFSRVLSLHKISATVQCTHGGAQKCKLNTMHAYYCQTV